MTALPDPDVPLYTWADLLLSWQVGRAFGFREGVRAYSAAVDWMVAQAVDGPHEWDGRAFWGPPLDEVARETVMGLYRRYLLLTPGGIDVGAAPPGAQPSTDPPGRMAWGDRGDRPRDRTWHRGRPGRDPRLDPVTVRGDRG